MFEDFLHNVKHLKHSNERDGESYYHVYLCDSQEEHIETIRRCLNKQKNLFIPTLKKTEGKFNNNKFRQVFSLAKYLEDDKLTSLRTFLSLGGDNQSVPYLFASILFNCHTEKTIDFIVKAVGANNNLQKRHPIQFAYDLVTGWIPEHFLANCFDLEKSGCDSDYKLAKGSSINGSQDFIFKGEKIELSMDYTGTIKYKNKFHLRYNKWNKIQKDKSNLLIICTKSWKYYFYSADTYLNNITHKYLDRIESWSDRQSVAGYELTGWETLEPIALSPSNLSNSFNNILSLKNEN